MRLASKLWTLSAREWRDLLAAQWALLAAQGRMRTRPTGSLLDQWSSGSGRSSADVGQLQRAREIGHAVRRVALYGLTRPQCLARSLAICEMLETERIQGAIVRIGVRPEDASLTAHAWVEYAGELIGDSRAHVRRFAVLATAGGMAKR
ncbi:MAG: lasso peptide biosynthesis B2 protein [Gemmatimonadaceae bacterium]